MRALVAAVWGCVVLGELVFASAVTWRHAAVLRQATTNVGVAQVDLSADGRFVAFESTALLTPDAIGERGHIYVFDRSSGVMTLESVSADGLFENGWSRHPRLSGDGRYLVFGSSSTNQAQPSERANHHVYLKDRQTGTVQLISRTRAGGPADGWSDDPEISDDGKTIVFTSSARNLIDTRSVRLNATDIYLFDASRRSIERIESGENGAQPVAGSSNTPTVSGDGRFVAFAAPVALDTPFTLIKHSQVARPLYVFLRDRLSRSTRLIGRNGLPPNGSTFHPSISGDGRWIAFTSSGAPVGSGDRNGLDDIYVHDTRTGQSRLVSRSVKGGSGDGSSSFPTLSFDGRYVVFVSTASDLICVRRCAPQRSDVNLIADVFRFDTSTGTVERISGGESGEWWEASAGPAVDASGEVIAFSSRHPVEPADMVHDFDLFVATRVALQPD